MRSGYSFCAPVFVEHVKSVQRNRQTTAQSEWKDEYRKSFHLHLKIPRPAHTADWLDWTWELVTKRLPVKIPPACFWPFGPAYILQLNSTHKCSRGADQWLTVEDKKSQEQLCT